MVGFNCAMGGHVQAEGAVEKFWQETLADIRKATEGLGKDFLDDCLNKGAEYCQKKYVQ